MLNKDTLEFLVKLFTDSTAVFAGQTYVLKSTQTGGVFLEGSDANALAGLIQRLNPVAQGFEQIVASSSAPITYASVLSPEGFQRLGRVVGMKNINHEMTTTKSSIDYTLFKKMGATAETGYLLQLGTLKGDARFQAQPDQQLIGDAWTYIAQAKQAVNDLQASAATLNATTSAADYERFIHALNLAQFTANRLMRFLQDLNHMQTDLAQELRTTFAQFSANPEFAPLIHLTQAGTRLNQETQKCHALGALYALEEIERTDSANRKLAAKNAVVIGKLQSAKAAAYLGKLAKSGVAAPKANQAFIFTADADGNYYIKPNPPFPNLMAYLKMGALIWALHTEFNRKINVDTEGNVCLSSDDAAAFCAKFSAALPPLVSRTTATGLTDTPAASTSNTSAGSSSSSTRATHPHAFDLSLAANKTALKQAVETTFGWTWDESDPLAIKISKANEAPGREIFVNAGTNAGQPSSLETLSKDPEVYERMASLMDALKPTATNTDGVTGVLLSNDQNDKTELAILAKKMLDKDLRVEIDFSPKPPTVRAFTDDDFKAALSSLGVPGLVKKYEDKLNEMTVAPSSPRPT